MIATTIPHVGTTPAQLICRLRLTARHGNPTSGEIEIQNASSLAIDIPADVHPLQHLDIRVTDGQGKVVSTEWYGNQFSPAERGTTLRLNPGESYIAPVSLLATVPSSLRVPGAYTVQAVFEFPGMRIVSQPLTLTI